MATLILSGVGGTANWLPLILPLVVLLGILTLTDATIKFIRNKRLAHTADDTLSLHEEQDSEQ